MLLSKACEYGIRTALHLSTCSTCGNVPVRSVSDDLGIPYHFLAKIVQTLTQKGIVASTRGPSGGIALARPAYQIKLREVVVAIDGPGIFTRCILGLPNCGSDKPCPLHADWVGARDRIHRMFDHVSLAEMAEQMEAGDFRLESVLKEPDVQE